MRYGAADSSRSQTQIRISSHTENDKVRFRSLETHFYYLYLHFRQRYSFVFFKKFLSTQWATPLLDGLKGEQFKVFGKVVNDLEAAFDGDRNIHPPAQV